MNTTLTFIEVSCGKEPFYNLPYRYSKCPIKISSGSLCIQTESFVIDAYKQKV